MWLLWMGTGKPDPDNRVIIMSSITLQIQTIGSAPGGATQTVITDYATAAQEIELTTERFDTPSALTFTCLEDSGIAIRKEVPWSFL